MRRAAGEPEEGAGRSGGGREPEGRARKDHGRGVVVMRLGGRGRSARSGRGHGARRGGCGR